MPGVLRAQRWLTSNPDRGLHESECSSHTHAAPAVWQVGRDRCGGPLARVTPRVSGHQDKGLVRRWGGTADAQADPCGVQAGVSCRLRAWGGLREPRQDSRRERPPSALSPRPRGHRDMAQSRGATSKNTADRVQLQRVFTGSGGRTGGSAPLPHQGTGAGGPVRLVSGEVRAAAG